ncbi:MAG TPA: UDP-N-acetylmuramate--L-alanine ligase, partial [Alphaproteobacteria bacterium]|nr:UDP-N-acetylmuramate--L-alanine ligase [Alphaproteobacteria bacterium]
MLRRARRIHFVGIGGIGMSGIAEVLFNLKFDVTGSDIAESPITERLSSLGISVKTGHDASHVAGADAVVVSSAIRADNAELAAAREAGIPVIPRSDMLGELLRMKTGIAVAGAHGKTTTTSMAAAVLEHAGLDPTVVVGGRVKSRGSNVRLGKGEYLVAEADESDGNFVRLSPAVAIITNIDLEHLDFYGGLEQIYEAFVAFARRVPFNGPVVLCVDDPHIRAIMPRIDRRIVSCGTGEDAEVRGSIEEESPAGTLFSVSVRGEKRARVRLRLPGRHNVRNALCVFGLAEELEIDAATVRDALEEFQGVARRFEVKGERDGVLYVDDYAHHPTEIAAVVQAARQAYDRRLVVVFQPHRYTRTRDLHERFSGCFAAADETIVTGIYAAGEAPIPGVTAELIYRAARRGGARVTYIPDREDLRPALGELLRPGDLVLTLGAGDIYRLAEQILAGEGKGSG